MADPCCANPNYSIQGDYAVCKNCGNSRALAVTHVITVDKAEQHSDVKLTMEANAHTYTPPKENDEETTDGKG